MVSSVASPATAAGGTGGHNKGKKKGAGVGANNNSLLRQHPQQQQRNKTPPPRAQQVQQTPEQLNRSTSMEGPIPLRRASYAFDQAQQHMINGNGRLIHSKAGTPPFQINSPLVHQHSAPPAGANPNSQPPDSDCGSSSGLGGMGTPVKGESGCSISCSASSNNSMADCSHDSRDSGGPISSPGAIDQMSQNGHRSLVASATLTPSMVQQQPVITTISPVSTLAAVPHSTAAAAAVHQQQQMFSNVVQQAHSAFTLPPHSTGQHQPYSLPPAFAHQLAHQHFPTLAAVHQQQPHQQNAAAHFNALHAASMLAPPPGITGAHQYANGVPKQWPAPQGGCNEPSSCSPQPPMGPGNGGCGGGMGPPTQSSPMLATGPPPHGAAGGRALYLVTCESAALASVGTAAISAGYHVTLEPCASAPPIILTSAQQQQPPSTPTAAQGSIQPPPGFTSAAVPSTTPSNINSAGGQGTAGGQGQGSTTNNGQNGGGGGGRSSSQSPPSAAINGSNEVAGNNSIGNMPPGVPPEIAAAINGGHDLFVHIHPGDAISLAVGNEIQHIHGPATIRMVTHMTPPSAIPMNIPQGHVVQQLLDREGYLSHIIMSQEVAPAAVAPPPPPPPPVGVSAVQHQQPQPLAVPVPSSASNSTHQQRHAHQQQQKGGGGGSRRHSRPSPSSSASPPGNQPPQQQQVHHQYGGSGYAAEAHQHQHHQQQQQQMMPLNKWNSQQRPAPQPMAVHGGGQYGPRRGPYYAVDQQHQQFGPSVSPAAGHPPPHHNQQQQIGGIPYDGGVLINPSGNPSAITIEEEERERLREALSALSPPNVTGVGMFEADVVWQELDTSEAAASLPGFPEINQSEFAYQIILYNQHTQNSKYYTTTAISGNVMHLRDLCPATDYMVCVRADLPVHEIAGHPTTVTPFRTQCAPPSRPDAPKVVSRQPTTVSLQWRAPNCNGAPILGYSIQMAKGRSSGSQFELVFEGLHEQTVITGLEPGVAYRIRLIARNEIGSSEFSQVLTVYPERGSIEHAPSRGLSQHGGGQQQYYHQQPHHQTYHHQQQHQQYSKSSSPASSIQHQLQGGGTGAAALQRPMAPSVISVNARAVKLGWNEQQQQQSADYLQLSLEMCDFSGRGSSPHFVPVPAEFYAPSGSCANVTGLQSNREYRFRLAAVTPHNETLYSDFVSVRTRIDQQQHQQRFEQQHGHSDQREKTLTPLRSVYEDETNTIINTDHHHHHRVSVSPIIVQQNKGSSIAKEQKKSSASVAGGAQQQQKKQSAGQQQKPIIQQQQKEASSKQNARQSSPPSHEQAISLLEKTSSNLQQVQQQPKAPSCSTPKFIGLTSTCAKISWRLILASGGNDGSPKKKSNNSSDQASTNVATGTTLLYELQRVDRQQPQIVFSGAETDYQLTGLRPVEHMQLRVRAVLLDTEGRRLEGDWSQVTSACTLPAPPSAPRNVRLSEPETTTPTSSAGEGDEQPQHQQKAAIATAKSSSSHQHHAHSHHHPQHHSITLCWDPPTQLNGASITEYTVHMQRYPIQSNEKAEVAEKKQQPLEERLLSSITETEFFVQRLLPAQRYLFTVGAANEAGPSPKSEPFEYISPPGVPESPRDVHAEALSTSELQLSWSEPVNNNGSPIVSYHVNCYRLYSKHSSHVADSASGLLSSSSTSLPQAAAVSPSSSSSSGGRHRQLVSQQIVPSYQRLLMVQSLETETDYELQLQAENSVGKGAREMIRCTTLADPPQPPELALVQATANTLKLKWTPAAQQQQQQEATTATANHYYYLERENENGTYSPVYEGDLRTAKVKGLRERTQHHFRIRAALGKAHMFGSWSRRFSFQTTRQPPPAPKQAPVAMELSPDLFQLEWAPAIRAISSGREQSTASPNVSEEQQSAQEGGTEQQYQFVYRVQIAPKVASSAKEKVFVEVWRNVYEGTGTTCTVSVPNANQQQRQARLFVVQQFLSSNGQQITEETVSAPSPVVVFSSQRTPNESPKKRPLAGNKAQASSPRGRQQQAAVHYPNPKEPKVSFYKRFKRFGSWMKKTVSEKDCALIVLAIFVALAFGIAILLNNYYLN